MGIEYLVVIMLTFMDGSVAQYNNGQWETVVGYKECQDKVKTSVAEMKEMYKDSSESKPSTFMTACIQKNQPGGSE